MPPKLKLHKNPGKPAPGPPKLATTTVTSHPQSVEERVAGPSSATVQMDPELERKFEAELCWCIQNLRIALNSGKLKPKEAQQSSKDLTTLMSSSAPIIKKRQVMRGAFGDYRTKMAEEEKKTAKKQKTTVKITPASRPSQNSVFVRKAGSKTNEFRFNFQHDEPSSHPEFGANPAGDAALNQEVQPNLEVLQINPETQQQEVSSVKTFCPKITTSDNSFRFNFSSANNGINGNDC